MRRRSAINQCNTILTSLVVTLVCAYAEASGIAEAFKDLDAEIRASVVKELIRSRAYDLEYTQNRPKNKKSGDSDEKPYAASSQSDDKQSRSSTNSIGGGLKNTRSRDGGDSNIEDIKDALEEDSHERPSREKVCSMEIASQKKESNKPTPRRQTIVITDPIIQICK